MVRNPVLIFVTIMRNGRPGCWFVHVFGAFSWMEGEGLLLLLEPGGEDNGNEYDPLVFHLHKDSVFFFLSVVVNQIAVGYVIIN